MKMHDDDGGVVRFRAPTWRRAVTLFVHYWRLGYRPWRTSVIEPEGKDQ